MKYVVLIKENKSVSGKSSDVDFTQGSVNLFL